jgi:predicted nucleic acid-binding protein
VIAETLRSAPIALLSVTPDDAIRAARLEAQYNVPFADSVAAALVGNQNVLVTADVEHFERVPKLCLLKLPRAKRT